ncbi:MAG: hypothetical protein JWM93_2439 [Frankiales bacterium]|nr:hypothetical protein [Frankiales bacterium]
MSLADLLGDPVACVPCAINGDPATAIPGSDLCLFHVGVQLSREAVSQ